ncbi:MAG: PEP-CTERM sorting domain-containing protein [Pirellulales bacterium]|nr:PEP-CTERM sorting domain-containing protein [Pirellulales bacterium]
MKIVHGALCMLAVVALGACPAAALTTLTSVELVANFDGGNTQSTPDAYTGCWGNGWEAKWDPGVLQTSNPPGVMTPMDLDYSPLDPANNTGNYFHVTANADGSDPGRISLFRDCRGELGMDVTQPYSIDFLLRIDEGAIDLLTNFTEPNDRYQIFDSYQDFTSSPTGFWIGAHGNDSNDNPWVPTEDVGYWCFFDGHKDGSIGRQDDGGDWSYWKNTGFQLTSGTTYTFHIDVDPANQEYAASISSDRVGDPAEFSMSGLGWRTGETTLSGMTHFVAKCSDTTDSRGYSLDSVRFSQTRTITIGGMNQVAAHFDGGEGETSEDGFIGKEGAGWKTAWQKRNDRCTMTTAVLDGTTGTEIKESGNYLQMTVSNINPGSTGYSIGGVSRDYGCINEDGIDWTQKHSISFLVRIDEDVVWNFQFTTGYDSYQIFDCPYARGGTNSETSWAAYASGDTAADWWFMDGPVDRVDSDIALRQNGVYEFTITVDPTTQTYDVELTDDLDNEFSQTGLAWRTGSDTIGGVLNFMARGDSADDTRAWSIDEIIIKQLGVSVPGDTDGDGKVNAVDARKLAENWLADVGEGGASEGDFNGDGTVDDLDASILAANWTGDTEGVGVPEPSTFMLLILGGVMLAIRRRRGR